MPQTDSHTAGFRPFFNPATGEWITYTAIAADSDGQLVRFNWRSVPGGIITEHIHPRQEERFTILAGQAHFTLGGEHYVARAGETIIVPAGMPHSEGNPGPGEIEGVVELRPALLTKEFHEALAGLVADGKTTPRGALSAASRSRSARPAGATPVRSIAFTSMCPASTGASSAVRPVSTFTTPPGRSKVASTSAGLLADLGEQQRGQRCGLGGLEHAGVAGRECGRQLPGGHQQREVPRDHLTGYPQWPRRGPEPGVPNSPPMNRPYSLASVTMSRDSAAGA